MRYDQFKINLVEADAVIDIKQDGIPVWQRVNRGGSTTITIVQRQ